MDDLSEHLESHITDELLDAVRVEFPVDRPADGMAERDYQGMGGSSVTTVFHYSDTMRLPWILDSGELSPGTASKTEFEGLPGLKLVFGTSNPNEARSADAFFDNTRYQDGLVWAVRFTLGAEHFEPWPEAVKHLPGWTGDRIKRFEATAKGDNPTEWYTCANTLARSKWLAIHARSYDQPVWRELKLDMPVESRIEIGRASGLGKPCKPTFTGFPAVSAPGSLH